MNSFSMKERSVLHPVLVPLFLAAVLTACGGSGADTESNPPPRTVDVSDYTGPPPEFPDVQAFRVSLWEPVRGTDRCGQCHVPGVQGPFFARSDDVNQAYSAALPLVDLDDPAQSRLVTKVGGGHNCWLASNQACADIMTTWIESWAGGSSSEGREIELVEPVIKDPGESKNFPYNPDGTAPDSYRVVYDVLTDSGNANCSRCHAPDAATAISPYFGSQDYNEAYEAAKSKINLNTPEDSRFVVRVRDEFHACWSGDCEADGTVIENAIAAFAGTIDPDEVDPAEFTFSKALQLEDGVIASGGNRYEDNQIAFWEFKTGVGNIAFDTSGVDPAIDLTLSGDIEWFGGYGINIRSGRAQGSAAASRKLTNAITSTGEFAIEAWVVPANVTQEDAYIISYSGSNTARNVTVGQNLYNYFALTRSSNAGEDAANGMPAIATADDAEVAQASLQHVVVNYDPVEGRSIYVNGQWTGDLDPAPPGTLGSWNESFAFILGNEASGERQWQGVIRQAAVHNRVLTPEQIQQNFEVGVGEKYFLLFYLGHILTDIPKPYLLLEVSQFDSYSYLFNEPRFISLEEGAAPENVTIAGIRVGINGRLPAIGQGFQNIDTTSPEFNEPYGPLGQLLSAQGTILPLDGGPETDEFYLTFDVLGDATNVFVEPVPLTPAPPPDGERGPDIGLRTFDEISATMAALTGVDAQDPGVRFTFNRVRAQLPTVENAEGFLAAHQMAVAQMAIEYCNSLVDDSDQRAAFWPDINFPGTGPASMNELFGLAANPDDILDPLVDRLTLPETPGNGLSSQPDVAATKAELNSLMNNLTACYNPATNNDSCAAGRSDIVLKAVCAAAIGNAGMLIQ